MGGENSGEITSEHYRAIAQALHVQRGCRMFNKFMTRLALGMLELRSLEGCWHRRMPPIGRKAAIGGAIPGEAPKQFSVCRQEMLGKGTIVCLELEVSTGFCVAEIGGHHLRSYASRPRKAPSRGHFP